MGLLRFVKRAALVIALGAVCLVIGVSGYFRIEQYKFLRQAERLLSDVRELELKKASAAQVKVIVREWGFEQPDKPCTANECVYHFRLIPKPARPYVLDYPALT